MTWGPPNSPDDHRQTLCQVYDDQGQPCGGNSSDCPAWDVLPDGQIELSSSHDIDRTGPTLVFRPHEWAQVFDAVRNNRLPKFLTDAIAADEAVVIARVKELTFMRDGHSPDYGPDEARELAELTGTQLVLPDGEMPEPNDRRTRLV